jgi:uncharacterized LabA/DUF88 family protein
VTTNVYIDGFNLYYGCVKGTAYRWLDLDALCRRLLPNEHIGRIRYFTARVSARPNDPNGPVRQMVYLRALATRPAITVHFGHFLTNVATMPLAKPPLVGSKKARVLKTEEKGSDVNLASHLLLDGFRVDYDTAVVISNDSDLREPVRMVRYELRKRVGVINPHPASRRSRELSEEAHFFKQIRESALATCLFPDSLVDTTGTFQKPKGW